MTPERARAYSHVIDTLAELGPAKLHADEQALVREAADALLFSDVVDDEVRSVVVRLDQMLDRLLDSGRLMPDTADALAESVEECGPQPVPA